MTTSLENLLDSTFFLMYHLKISPTEIDNLTTYEMRRYINMLRENLKSERESESSIIGTLFKLLGLKK